ncbi:MAG: transcriptional regulator LysR family [Betaproteobacteria bacterium]|nr:transcriptional regulator LysR family [Betaproteobacteria bacterium]
MNLSRIDLISLRLFVAVASTGSISKGAARSHLALAAASKRVGELEDAAQARLFYRHPKGVELTPAGHAMLHHAQALLVGLERMAGELADFAGGVRGHVRIWANTSAVTQFLPEQLAEFCAGHPNIKIDLEEQMSSDTVRALLEGRADVGIFAGNVPADGLETRKYQNDNLTLITPKKHPLARRKTVAFADAQPYDFVGLHQTASISALLAEANSASAPIRMRVQVKSFDAMCRMIAAGLGVGVLPAAAAAPHMRSMGLTSIPLSDEWAKRQLLLGVRSLSALSAPARALFDALLP